MNISTVDKGGAVVVTLQGEVDLQTSPDVRKALLGEVEAKKTVIVAMGGVEYIDSSGVASLVEAYQVARKHGSPFSLVEVSPSAMRVLQLARLDRVFTIHETVDAALAADG